MESLAFSPFEPVEPVPSFLSDEILQMEIVDRKQSSLATPDNAVYDMAILTESGLSVAECSANADGDGGFGISDPDLVVEGGFNGFYYGDGMAALAGSSGISVFIDDSQLPERAMNFIRDADAAPLSIPGRANDVARLGGGKQQTYKYVAASDDGLIAFNVQKKPYADIDNVRSACIFSGMLVYIVQNGEHWELYVKDGDKDGDDAIKVASFPTET